VLHAGTIRLPPEVPLVVAWLLRREDEAEDRVQTGEGGGPEREHGTILSDLVTGDNAEPFR
jgi:hypothetical protein